MNPPMPHPKPAARPLKARRRIPRKRSVRGEAKKRRKPQTKRSSRDKYAMTLWSKYIRDRAGRRCERCGASEEALLSMGRHLEGAHIESRRKRSTRYLVDNGIALCAPDRRGVAGGCHYWFDFQASGKERVDFAYEKRGAALDAVLDLVKQRWDRDLDRALKEIKAARASLKAA